MDRFSSTEDAPEWAKQPFYNGQRARRAGKPRDSIPANLVKSSFAWKSWIAGWTDMDAGLTADAEAVATKAGCSACQCLDRCAKAKECVHAGPPVEPPDARTLENWLKEASRSTGSTDAVSMRTVVAQRLVELATRAAVQAERERCARLLEVDRQTLLLLAGEMSAQEIRTVRAVLKQRAHAIRANPTLAPEVPAQ